MYSLSGSGYVLVKTKATHEMGTGVKGVDGKELVVDIAYNPMHYALNYADVYQLPFEMGNSMIAQIPCGPPGYGPIRMPHGSEESPSMDIYAIGGVYKYKYVKDIEPDVQHGDRIYFKPRTLNSRANHLGTIKDDKGNPKEYIYKVHYENIFCAVRNKKVIMIGGWVFLEPIWKDWKDLLIPTFYPYKDKDGNPIRRPKSEWMQKKVVPAHDNQRASIAHIGKPLKGDACDFKPGMRIVFRQQVKVFFQTVEGKKYIVLPQDQLLGELLEDVQIQ